MPLRLRPATLADTPALGELLYRCASTYTDWQADWTAPKSAQDFTVYMAEHLAEPGTWMTLAQDGEDIVAVVSYGPSAGREGDLAAPGLSYLKTLFVSPSHWGSGLADELIGRGEAAMRAQGFHSSYLWTMAGNGRARRFYERRGWYHDGAGRYHPVHKLDMVRYRRALAGER